MADLKISGLTAYTPALDTDVIPIVDVTTATTKKITKANFLLTIPSATTATTQSANDNSTKVATTAYVDAADLDGWSHTNETWAYASANTITVPTGAASRYQKGDRIKWTQTTVKYGVIIAVADTVLTIAINSDYVVTNAAISLNYYSHQANPLGYPTYFNYTSTFTGFSGSVTSASFFSVVGKLVTVTIPVVTGTSNANTFTMSLPIAPYSTINASFSTGRIANNGGFYTTSGEYRILGSDTTVIVFVDWQEAGWATSNAKGGGTTISYYI